MEHSYIKIFLKVILKRIKTGASKMAIDTIEGIEKEKEREKQKIENIKQEEKKD